MSDLRLKYLRKNRNLSQYDLAELLKISRAAYSLYETGKRQMNYQTLRTLALYYDVTIDFLLGISDIDEFFTDDEKNLIKRYRELDSRGKTVVNVIIDHEGKLSFKKS